MLHTEVEVRQESATIDQKLNYFGHLCILLQNGKITKEEWNSKVEGVEKALGFNLTKNPVSGFVMPKESAHERVIKNLLSVVSIILNKHQDICYNLDNNNFTNNYKLGQITEINDSIGKICAETLPG
jgi:hypothetical protein